MNEPDTGVGVAAPTATAQYVGRHRRVYRSDDPARGEAALALAEEWGVPTDKLPEVVAAWGVRCRLVEYADGGIRCQKCRSISFRTEDDE